MLSLKTVYFAKFACIGNIEEHREIIIVVDNLVRDIRANLLRHHGRRRVVPVFAPIEYITRSESGESNGSANNPY